MVMSTNNRASTTNGTAANALNMAEKSHFETQRELLVGEIAQVCTSPLPLPFPLLPSFVLPPT
jgi:hypothetical protein